MPHCNDCTGQLLTPLCIDLIQLVAIGDENFRVELLVLIDRRRRRLDVDWIRHSVTARAVVAVENRRWSIARENARRSVMQCRWWCMLVLKRNTTVLNETTVVVDVHVDVLVGPAGTVSTVLVNAITFAIASPMLIIRMDTPTNSVLRLIATRKASSVFITPRKNITGTIIACSRLIRPNVRDSENT
uniref:Uncharacterized protein n=1 Tax=Anopheles melas TaxID=34690 RepID=A0A182U1N5_9DIPT